MSSPYLPYTHQAIDGEDVDAVTRAMQGNLLSGGPYVTAFEDALSATTGAAQAVVCANGTAALHLCMLALGLGNGDSVVVPTTTFAATANAARFVGAEVVFADVAPDNGLLTVDTLKDAIARSVGSIRAVLPVHLGGQVCDMPAIGAFARANGLAVVEDACHALGGIADGHTVGNAEYSQAAVFSFHPAKTITMGEGGAITTNDAAMADTLRRFRSHCSERDPTRFENLAMAGTTEEGANPWYHEFQELGFNYRASDLNCALGLSQLGKLDTFLSQRKALVKRYEERLSPLKPVVTPVKRVPMERTGWHLFSVLIDFETAETSRANVMRELESRGIGTQVHYIPVHKQPYYTKRYGDLTLPGSEAYYARTLSLPLFSTMSDGDVDRVVDALIVVLGL